jgi:hypothetical protein
MLDVNGAAAKPRRFRCMSKATVGSPRTFREPPAATDISMTSTSQIIKPPSPKALKLPDKQVRQQSGCRTFLSFAACRLRFRTTIAQNISLDEWPPSA